MEAKMKMNAVTMDALIEAVILAACFEVFLRTGVLCATASVK